VIVDQSSQGLERFVNLPFVNSPRAVVRSCMCTRNEWAGGWLPSARNVAPLPPGAHPKAARPSNRPRERAGNNEPQRIKTAPCGIKAFGRALWPAKARRPTPGCEHFPPPSLPRERDQFPMPLSPRLRPTAGHPNRGVGEKGLTVEENLSNLRG